VGERLCYVAEYRGQWLALLGWAAAAYRVQAREVWIGWNDNQRRGRLPLVANNVRFCMLPATGQYPNLASWILARNLERLSADWQAAYGHPIILVESFVDSQLFRGTAYQACGWKAVGLMAKRCGAVKAPNWSAPSTRRADAPWGWSEWTTRATRFPLGAPCGIAVPCALGLTAGRMRTTLSSIHSYRSSTLEKPEMRTERIAGSVQSFSWDFQLEGVARASSLLYRGFPIRSSSARRT